MKAAQLFRYSSIALLIPSTLIGFIWPFFATSQALANRAEWFFLISTTISIFLIVSLVATDDLGSKNVAFLGILSALVAALRPLGIGAIGIEPMWFLLILAARVMGPTFGFLLGALSMSLSALLTGGIGPWLVYQVFAAAIIGFGVGVIPKRAHGKLELALLAIYGAIAAEVFGILMDLQFWPWALGLETQLSYIPNGDIATNLNRFIVFHFATSMAWDIPRAILTSTLIILSAPAILGALRRTKFRAAFVTPIEFVDSKNAAIERAKELKAL